jgi:hypothetical protein
MATRVFSFFNDDVIESFILTTSGLFEDEEYLLLGNKIDELLYKKDAWERFSESLTSEQKDLFTDFYDVPVGWPFYLVVALDEDKHSKAISMLALSDVGMEVSRPIEFDHRNMVNLSFDKGIWLEEQLVR